MRVSAGRAAVLVLVAALAVGSTGGCTAGGSPGSGASGHLTIASGGTTGVYHAYADELRRVIAEDVPGLSADVMTTAGSGENISLITTGRAQLGFSTADSVYSAGPPSSLRAVARVYDEYIHVVVRASSKVRTVRDLKGLRVSTGQAGSSTELVADRLLGAVGLTTADLARSRLGIGESADALQAGRIDAFFWSAGLPTPRVRTLADAVPIRLLPVADEVPTLRKQYGTYYRRATIPPATYTGVGEVATIAVPNYLLVASSLSEDTVYRLTQVLFARREQIASRVPSGQLLDARTAISTMPVPLHPGAERYYRDTKP
jgi:TRAP transporter TAXI family solute receptor